LKNKNKTFKILPARDQGGIIPIILGCLAGLVFFGIIAIVLMVMGFGFEKKSATPEPPPSSGGGTLSGVPAGWNSLFDAAGKTIDVPPAMIASIYLTEHHITSFSGDIDPLGTETPCSTSYYAGATGPFQLMPNWWSGRDAPMNTLAPLWGLQYPVDPCRYKDAAYGGAYVIKTKMNNASVKKGYKDPLTDDEVKLIAQGYCGACTASGCGNDQFSYCEFALERYKSIIGSVAYWDDIIKIAKALPDCRKRLTPLAKVTKL
jgi:hypothetical protein